MRAPANHREPRTLSAHSTLRHCAAVVCALVCAWLGLPQAASAQLYDMGDPATYRSAQDYALMLINRERDIAGLPRLRDDAVAAQAAMEHAREMQRLGYFSHWDPKGQKPTRRYNLLGGYHALTENVYFQQSDGLQLRESLDLMMDKLMESEGHRAAILSPRATHVGIGFAAQGRQLYAAQEFIVRVGGEYECPLTVRPGDEVEFSGRFDPARFSFSHILLLSEERPRPRSREWLSKTESYSEGDELLAALTAGNSLNFGELPVVDCVVVDPQSGRFICNTRLTESGQEGMFYLMLWLRDTRTGLRFMAACATMDVAR